MKEEVPAPESVPHQRVPNIDEKLSRDSRDFVALSHIDIGTTSARVLSVLDHSKNMCYGSLETIKATASRNDLVANIVPRRLQPYTEGAISEDMLQKDTATHLDAGVIEPTHKTRAIPFSLPGRKRARCVFAYISVVSTHRQSREHTCCYTWKTPGIDSETRPGLQRLTPGDGQASHLGPANRDKHTFISLPRTYGNSRLSFCSRSDPDTFQQGLNIIS